MKNLFITLLLIFAKTIFAQNTIIALEDDNGSKIPGAYYKDINNSLDTFVGTWLFNNGSETFKIVLQKDTLVSINNIYFKDLIIGEYQYIDENGVEKVNSLSNLSITLPHIYNHSIDGNFIVSDPSYWNCYDCSLGERRLMVSFSDPVNNIGGSMLIKKTTVAGQEAIRIEISYLFKSVFRYDEPVVIPTPSVPQGIHTLIKQ